jgi:MoxR-like ATPase
MFKKLSPEQWQKIEERVAEAEKTKRQSQSASHELYRETGETKTKRQGIKKEAILERARRKRVAEKALESEEIFKREAEEILEPENSPELALIVLQRKNLVFALRKNLELDIARRELLIEEAQILSGIEGEPSSAELEALEEVRRELKKLEEQKQELLESSPEAYFGLHLKELKEYKRALERGNFIETPSIRRIVEEFVEAIEIGKYPFLHGHTGSGKTEFAKYISRKLTGKSALLFSGSKETTKAELVGHLTLKRGIMPQLDDLLVLIDKEIKKDEERYPDLSEKERGLRNDFIRDYVFEREKTGTEVQFEFGDVYRAMREGRPLIIDEFNMIPHSIWGRLNELLKLKPGDIVHVQEDGVEDFPVKDGFFFIFTGNLNQGDERYIERVDLDPAGLRRIHPIKYDYLPQYYPKNNNDSLSLEDHASPDNELFQLILAKVSDRNGNISLPKNSLQKLWRLAVLARVTQDLFAGRYPIESFYPKIAGQTLRAPYFLKKINLDLGRIDAIISSWKMRQDRDLDFYIWRYGIGEAVDEQDKAFLLQLFKITGGFFQEWKSNEDEVLAGREKEVIIKIPAARSAVNQNNREFFGPRDTVEYAFGRAPERVKWPEIESASEDTENIEARLAEFETLHQFQKAFEKDLEILTKDMEDFCE